jgi:hypothetical protein
MLAAGRMECGGRHRGILLIRHAGRGIGDLHTAATAARSKLDCSSMAATAALLQALSLPCSTLSVERLCLLDSTLAVTAVAAARGGIVLPCIMSFTVVSHTRCTMHPAAQMKHNARAAVQYCSWHKKSHCSLCAHKALTGFCCVGWLCLPGTPLCCACADLCMLCRAVLCRRQQLLHWTPAA